MVLCFLLLLLNELLQEKGNWKAKHENLIATLRAARGQGPPAAPVIDPGYVECPYCSRNFNEHAAERHIPFCKEQSSRMPKNSGTAKSKLNKRTQVGTCRMLFDFSQTVLISKGVGGVTVD